MSVKTQKANQSHKSRPCRSVFLMTEKRGFSFIYLPPKSCIPSRANTTVKRKRRKSKLMMDFMELMRDTTRFLRDAQYLTESNHTHFCVYSYTLIYCTANGNSSAYLVILNILRSLSALSTLIPNDIPGLKKPQTTSKMLPTMTCNKNDFL